MRPFVDVIDAFHARTAPSDWLEGLIKAYVGAGIAADFYRTVAELLDPPTKALVVEVLSDTGHAEFVIARVRAAIEADPRVAGRLALWARRLVGEALGQAQRVAAEREPLARLLAGGTASQLGEIGRMFARLTDAHAHRMAALGLEQLAPDPHKLVSQPEPVARHAAPGPPAATRSLSQPELFGPREPAPGPPAADRSRLAEPDPARIRAADLDVSDLAGRHQHLAALLVLQDEDAALGLQRGGQRCLDVLLRRAGLDHQLALHGLHSDPDFHGTPLASFEANPVPGRDGAAAVTQATPRAKQRTRR